MDLILERMAYLNPELHLSHSDQWVKGIKLLPQQWEGLSEDYLYLTDQVFEHPICCEASIAILDPDHKWTVFPSSYIISHSTVPLADVLNELLGLQSLLQDWDLRLNLSVSQNMGIQHLLDLSEPVLGCPIAVLDPAFKCLAITSSFDTDDRVFRELMELGYLTQESFNILRDNKCFTRDHYTGETLILPPDSIKEYTSTFTAVLDEDGAHVRYEILMLFCNFPYSDGLFQLYLHLQGKLMHYLKEEASTDDSHARYEYFVIDLLEEHCASEMELRERSQYFLDQHPDNFNAVVIRLNNSTEMYRKYAHFTLKSLFPEYRFVHYRDSILFFVNLGNPNQHLEPHAQVTLSRLNDYLKQADAYAGVSIRFRELKDIRQAYFQAESALRLGKMLGTEDNRGQEKQIFWYSDYYVYHILDAAHERIPELDLLNALYKEIVQYDAAHHTDYRHILLTYLHHGRNYTDAAKELHMHRNNVIYHIQRMSELFQMNLDDPELRMQILLSERVHTMYPDCIGE